MSESKELKYILATQPSFWVAGINCYDHLVAVATLVARQLSVEFEGEDELGEMNNGHPADVADCVAWLLREAELLPMTTIKDIVDDYRERYHRYLATPSVESQAEFEAAITPMLQAVVDSAEREAEPNKGVTAELIDFTTLSAEERDEVVATIAEKIANGESVEAKAIVELYIVSAELPKAVWCALWWWEAPINKDAFFAWDHCFRGWQAAGCAAPVDPEIATDHRPRFADLGKAIKSWVVADIAQKIIDGKPSLAVASAKVFCQADSLPTLVWGKIEAIVATSQYAPLPSALTHFSYFIDGLGLGRKAD
jgi:hypothetical protein